MNTDKKRLSIDIKKAVFLRIQRAAIVSETKPKILIENYINNMYHTNKKKASAPKEVSAAAEKENVLEVKKDASGRDYYTLNGKRISKVKFQELTENN